MEIRSARLTDLETLIQFNRSMAIETEGKMLDPSQLRPGVAAVLNDREKGFYVVAESDARMIGGLMITFEWSDWRNAWFWWIQSVYVIPEARGKGVYARMYGFVKEMAAKAENVCGFRLYVEKENLVAQRSYSRLGMEPSHYLMYEEQTKTGFISGETNPAIP